MTVACQDAKLVDLRLRRYRPSDLNALSALDRLCFTAAFRFSRAAMRQFAEARNAISWLAETPTAELAGFVIVHLESAGADGLERIGYVVTLDVRPSLTRRGIATLLLDEVEQEAGKAGAKRMRLHVHSGNPDAIAFYVANNYVRVERVAGFYGAGGDAEVYERNLPSL